MTGQKPPDSKGRLSGYPYSGLWEEFGTIMDELGAEPAALGKAETLVGKLSAIELEALRYPTRAKVTKLVASFGEELGVENLDALGERLYELAAAYSLPKLQRAAEQDVTATAKRLQRLANTAEQLSGLWTGVQKGPR